VKWRSWILGAAAIVAIAASAIIGLDPDSPTRTTTPEFATPCNGIETTLEDAEEASTFEIVQPHTELANPRTLESVWACSTGGYLLLYSSDVSVLEGENTLIDPAKEWEGLASDYREFTVGKIHGTPASLADPDVDGAIGGVDFVVGQIRLTVSGNGDIPLEGLVAVAESLPITSELEPS
jgi:hypothetical protein